MTRVLIFFLSVVFLAGAITVFAGMGGRVDAEILGYRISPPTGIVFGFVLAVAALLVFFTSLIKDLMALPGKIRARETEARRARGVASLARGLEAVAVGDAADARHHARLAERNLDEPALTRLLTAQAAQLAGDEGTAQVNFSAMLEAPETEFLGLRGLYLQAMRGGDKEAARSYAERAFRLRGNARWAFESVFDLGLARGAWGEARDALVRARKNNLVDPDAARRGEAALLAAGAYADDVAQDDAAALGEAETALKLAPNFTPAAILAARLQVEAGHRKRAAKILEQSFAAAPHPALSKTYETLYTDEPVEKRAEMFERLAGKAPESREAKLLKARRHVLLGEWTAAATLLEPLLADRPTAREFAAMAAAMAGAYGEAAARAWFERAADAPRDPAPGADGEFHLTREGWARLVREFMEQERLAPPPLEDAPAGLSIDEIKLLTAPPLAIETPPEDVGASAAAASEEPEKPMKPKTPAEPELAETDEETDADSESETARAVAAAGKVS
ncbi:MAG: heme biosynthesis protein HemY [Parvularculaceae bacterium]